MQDSGNISLGAMQYAAFRYEKGHGPEKPSRTSRLRGEVKYQ